MVDTVKPTEEASLTQISADTGIQSNDFITGDTAPTFSGTLSAPLALGGQSGVSHETLMIQLTDQTTGQDVTNGFVAVSDFDNTTLSWEYTSSMLSNGNYAVQFEIKDAAGNTSAVMDDPQTIIIDTLVPSDAALIPQSGGNWFGITASDPGATTSGLTTDGTHLTFSGSYVGTLADGSGLSGVSAEHIEVNIDNTGWQMATVDTSSNTWSIDDSANTLDVGQHTVQVRIADAAGNAAFAYSDTITVNPPQIGEADITAITPDTLVNDGSYGSASDFITSTTLNKGNGSLLISGTTDATSGETVQVSFDGGKDWADANWSGSTWSYTAQPGDGSGYTGEGTYAAADVMVQVVNAGGLAGTSATSPGDITVDNTAPVEEIGFTNITVPTGNQLRILGSGEVQTTANTGITLSGTLSSGLVDTTANGASAEELQISVNGGAWQAIDSSDFSSPTAWNYTLPGALNSGSNTVQVRVVDEAGNIDVNEGALSITVVGTTPPPPNQLLNTYTVSTAHAGLGYSMTAIGDFNGDGYADYIVSAPMDHYNNTCGVAGKSTLYLLYGSANGLPDITNLANLTAAQGIKITSSSTTDQGIQGLTVRDIGDFNGDGKSDIAISSNINDTVYVLYGQTSTASINLNSLLPTQGFAVKGTTVGCTGSYIGQSVSGADLNGDGYSDLIIGYPANGTLAQGGVYVINGHAGAQGTITIDSQGNASGAVDGYSVQTGGSGLGTDMQAVGDVNGDGYTDYVTTAPGTINGSTSIPGSAYLLFGGPSGVSGGIAIAASNANEHLGGMAGAGCNNQQADAWYAQYHSVAGLGSIDGSGRDAFAIGSPGAINPYVSGSVADGAGAVYVIYGDQSSWSNITLPTYNTNLGTWSGGNLNGSNGFVIYSASFAAQAKGTEATASDLGFSISSAGDVNGDGISDFLIGAPEANNGAGAVFLVFGEAGGLPGASSGVVNLDALVAAGRASSVIDAPGTAIEYTGTQASGVSCTSPSGGNMGTDVTGGDFSGTGIDGYSFSAWGLTANGVAEAGQTYVYGGSTALLTQGISNAAAQIYYAGDNPIGSPAITSGVDLIATGSGNNDWVHGIGTDTTGTTSLSVQHDAVSGGAGNDYIGIVGTNFTSVDGGAGWNTLVFENSGLTVNLAQMGLRVQGFAEFDLNNQSNNAGTDPRDQFTGQTSGNTLALRLSDILSEANGTVGPSSQHMTILGDSTSTVQLDGTSSLAGSNWTNTTQQTIGGVTFDVYHNTTMGTNTAADLLIEHGVNVI